MSCRLTAPLPRSAVVVPVCRFPFPLYPFQVVQLHLEERWSAVGTDREGFVMPGLSRWVAGCLSHYTTWLFTVLIIFSSSLVCELLKNCFFFCRTAVGRVVCCSAFNYMMWLSLLNCSSFVTSLLQFITAELWSCHTAIWPPPSSFSHLGVICRFNKDIL